MKVWYSFQGCVIAVMPFVVATLTTIAAYVFLRRLGTPSFVTVWATVIIGACTFMLSTILKNKLGESDHERK